MAGAISTVGTGGLPILGLVQWLDLTEDAMLDKVIFANLQRVPHLIVVTLLCCSAETVMHSCISCVIEVLLDIV